MIERPHNRLGAFPPMRIAFVAQPFDNMRPPVRGGSLSLWIYYMARICAKRGHQTVIFGNHGEAFSPRSTTSDDVEYCFTPTGLDRLLNRTLRIGRHLRSSGPNGTSSPEVEAVRNPLFLSSWHHRGYAEQSAGECGS